MLQDHIFQLIQHSFVQLWGRHGRLWLCWVRIARATSAEYKRHCLRQLENNTSRRQSAASSYSSGQNGASWYSSNQHGHTELIVPFHSLDNGPRGKRNNGRGCSKDAPRMLRWQQNEDQLHPSKNPKRIDQNTLKNLHVYWFQGVFLNSSHYLSICSYLSLSM